MLFMQSWQFPGYCMTISGILWLLAEDEDWFYIHDIHIFISISRSLSISISTYIYIHTHIKLTRKPPGAADQFKRSPQIRLCFTQAWWKFWRKAIDMGNDGKKTWENRWEVMAKLMVKLNIILGTPHSWLVYFMENLWMDENSGYLHGLETCMWASWTEIDHRKHIAP